MLKRNDFLLLSLLALGFTACGASTVGGGGDAQVPGVVVDPDSVEVPPQGTVPFASAVYGTADTSVAWTVVESAGGTVNASGLYTAPSANGQYHVRAVSRAVPSLQATATVTVTSTPSQPPTAACATAPLRSTGTTYYYCDCGTGASSSCVPGNDANVGTSPSSPRRTFSNAMSRFAGLSSGDTVALCRGGAWDGATGGWYSKSCSASNTCDFRDYVPSWGTTATARPRINTGNGVMLWGFNGPTAGLRWWNLDIREGPDYSAGQGIWFATSSFQDVDMCNLRVDGSYLQFNMQATGSRNARFTVRNSEFLNSGFSAFIGTPPGTTFDGNVFTNNGLLSTPQMHTIYFVLPSGLSSDAPYQIVFKNNKVTTDTRCGGVMLVVHETFVQSQVIFENNLITTTSTNANCYGIQTSSSAASGDIRNAIVRRNRIQTPGPTALELSCCTNCVASDNILIGGDVWINGNTSCNGGNAGTGVTFQNNSLYQSVVSVGAVGSGYVVENNAVWTNGSSCFNIRAPTARNSANYCRTSGGVAVGTCWVDAPGGNFTPVKPGPLAGTGNQTTYSPVAIGTVTWSPTDPGVTRSPPVNAGAY